MCLCVSQLSMHLNSSLQKSNNDSKHNVLLFLPQHWKYELPLVLCSLLCHAHTSRNLIGSCCKSDTSLSFLIHYKRAVSPPVLCGGVMLTSNNLKHTLINRSIIQRHSGISTIHVSSYTDIHYSLIHKKHFPVCSVSF